MKPIVDTLDIGATDIGAKVEIRMFVRRQGERWRLTVFADDSIGLCTINEGSNLWYAPDLNVGRVREVLGYAIRRAICRGISASEIAEDNSGVQIDLGEMP